MFPVCFGEGHSRETHLPEWINLWKGMFSYFYRRALRRRLVGRAVLMDQQLAANTNQQAGLRRLDL